MSTSTVSIPQVPVKIKLFDSALPVPQYQTTGAAGFDLYARLDMILPPQQATFVPLNVAFQFPVNYWLMLVARSSLHKKGLHLINGIGVGDSDYCGNEDEYRAIIFNHTDQSVTLTKGERLVQGILIPAFQASFTVTNQLDANNRGGIGSTGTH